MLFRRSSLPARIAIVFVCGGLACVGGGALIAGTLEGDGQTALVVPFVGIYIVVAYVAITGVEWTLRGVRHIARMWRGLDLFGDPP